MSRVLLLGSGGRHEDMERDLLIRIKGAPKVTKLVTLDRNLDSQADVAWDLNNKPWPFEDNSFEEVHAYNIIEHIGRQGDAKMFFDEMYEVWRILVPWGHFYGCCPTMNNPWLLAEPSHTRVVLPWTFNFLSACKEEVEKAIETTSTSDFRYLWKGDLRFIERLDNYTDIDWGWIMSAVKGDDMGKTLTYIPGYATIQS